MPSERTLRMAGKGEALVYKPNGSGPAILFARVQADEWIAQAGN